MSTPPNPLFDASATTPPVEPSVPLPPFREEDPPWSGWDVLGIAVVTVLSIIVFLFATTFAAQHLLFPHIPLFEVAKYPLVTVVAQGLAYLAVFAFMIVLVKRGRGQPFARSIRWNWPRGFACLGYILGGAVLAIALQILVHFLPMPKELPMDRFFQTASEAWALSFFGVTFAPLFEELFFRGFLYPVLARRLGIVAAVILTALGFGLIHAAQLGNAWAPVLMVILVGFALTITRAVTKAVAPGLIIHIAYNGTLSALIFKYSDGFHHLDKLG